MGDLWYPVTWKLVVALIFTWVIIYRCVRAGVKTMEKMSTIFTIVPYFVLMFLLGKYNNFLKIIFVNTYLQFPFRGVK